MSADLGHIKVLLGVSGGISAYKSVDLAARLAKAGASVRTVMTANAARLVGAVSFEAVTGGDVYTSMWDRPQQDVGHIGLADWADIVVIAPATANIIGKIANGICDDLLSTTACACWAKLWVVAPAMNTRMWQSPAVQRNVEFMTRQMDCRFAGPETGRLACGDQGVGRMAEPGSIAQAVAEVAARLKSR